jgi:transposase
MLRKYAAMPRKRTEMRKVKDVLRLKFEVGLSHRDVGKCLSLGPATVSEVLSRFKASDLSWPLPDGLSDIQLEGKLYTTTAAKRSKRLPDFTKMKQELKRKGMTKLLLWQEYCQEDNTTAYGYTQYCEHYQIWLKKQKRSMRQHHVAGDKLFIDYCGPTIPIISPDTGEIRYNAQIFVATLGATNYTYVEAGRSQKQEDWIMAHVRAFNYIGGVPRLLVPDNLKSAVIKAHPYSPTLNENYVKMARHYGTAIMPARPYKPKDKAKAENAVLIVERWILMRLRHYMFYTLSDLNVKIKVLMEDLNTRQQRMYPGSRKQQFELLDKPALASLPVYPYEYIDSKRAKVSPDYHVLYEKHAYSVPNGLVGDTVTVEASANIVCIYHHNQLVAQHTRTHKDGGFTTIKEHMPHSHVKQRFGSDRLLSWAENIGVGARGVVEWHIQSRKHPEQAIKSCLAILHLTKQYGNTRVEAACQKALLLERPHRTVVVNLLNNHKEIAQPAPEQEENPVTHHNIRGQHYYQ